MDVITYIYGAFTYPMVDVRDPLGGLFHATVWLMGLVYCHDWIDNMYQYVS